MSANPYAPPKANVADADVESEGIEQAGRGARFGAAILDFLFLGVAYAPAFIVVGIDAIVATNGNFMELFRGPFGITALCGLAVWGAITFILVKRNSQTLGKKLVGIKVVRSDGSHASIARIFWLRNIVNAIPTAIPFVGSIYGLVDPLFIFSESRQCVHDKIADTIVIKA